MTKAQDKIKFRTKIQTKFQLSAPVVLAQSLLWALFVVSLVVFLLNSLGGSRSVELFSVQWTGFSSSIGLRFDFLSTSLLVMVTLLGAVIGRFSLRYLMGEKRQGYFYFYLLFTLVAVSLLLLSNQLIEFFLMWFAVSFGLDRLLTYYCQRRAAVLAARKKYWISRLGDLVLIGAIFLTYRIYGTLDLSKLLLLSQNARRVSGEFSAMSLLYVVAAMTKSAQFPFHFWLPETIETPAPVSALMHAGIVNAGGFLILRLSPLFWNSGLAPILLAISGSFTAVFGALVMITQNDIKKKLTYSTISQMGMMMLTCGLGAFSLALFHIVAHSFYKAHAFLTTGFLVEESKRSKFDHLPPGRGLFLAASILGSLVLALGAHYRGGHDLAYFTYAALLMLGMAQNINFSNRPLLSMGGKFFARVSLVFVFAVLACAVIEYGFHRHLAPLLPVHLQPSVALCWLCYFVFVIGFWLSGRLSEARTLWVQKLYVFLWNGAYFNPLTTRALKAKV